MTTILQKSKLRHAGITTKTTLISVAQLVCFLGTPRKYLISYTSLSCSLWLILLYSLFMKLDMYSWLLVMAQKIMGTA